MRRVGGATVSKCSRCSSAAHCRAAALLRPAQMAWTPLLGDATGGACVPRQCGPVGRFPPTPIIACPCLPVALPFASPRLASLRLTWPGGTDQAKPSRVRPQTVCLERTLGGQRNHRAVRPVLSPLSPLSALKPACVPSVAEQQRLHAAHWPPCRAPPVCSLCAARLDGQPCCLRSPLHVPGRGT